MRLVIVAVIFRVEHLILYSVTGMKRNIFLLTLMPILIGISACGEKNMDLPGEIQNFQDSQLVLVIYSEGNIVNEKTIEKDENLYANIKKWLSENSIGWKSSYTNYVPEYIIRGKTFSIRKNGSFYTVIYEKGEKDFVQLEKEMETSNFIDLNN